MDVPIACSLECLHVRGKEHTSASRSTVNAENAVLNSGSSICTFISITIQHTTTS